MSAPRDDSKTLPPGRLRPEVIALRVIGMISLLYVGIGYWYLTIVAWSIFIKPRHGINMPPAFHWYYGMMAGLCAVFTTALLVIGIKLLRAKSEAVPWFISLMIAQTCYFFSIGFSWLIPRIGIGIASATGVANGGLAVQVFTLFPLWASFLAFWARKRIERRTPLSGPGFS